MEVGQHARMDSVKTWPYDLQESEEQEAPPAPPTHVPLFSWDAGGSWTGDLAGSEGEYGFAFEPQRDVNITAIGRHVESDRNHKGLWANAWVTLWRGEWGFKDKLHVLEVGPFDLQEIKGTYAFKYLSEPITLKAHREYVLTQTCATDMKDSCGNDHPAGAGDVELYSALACAKVTHGVHGDVQHQFPSEKDEDPDGILNMGMLNL